MSDSRALCEPRHLELARLASEASVENPARLHFSDWRSVHQGSSRVVLLLPRRHMLAQATSAFYRLELRQVVDLVVASREQALRRPIRLRERLAAAHH